MPIEQIREVMLGKLQLREAASLHRQQLIARGKQIEAAIEMCTQLSENPDVNAVLQRIDSEDTEKYLFRQWWRDYLENAARNFYRVLIGFVPGVVGLLVNMMFQNIFLLPIISEICICLLFCGWGAIGYCTTAYWGDLRKNVLICHSVLGVSTFLLVAQNWLTDQVQAQTEGVMEAAKYLAEYPFHFLVPFRIGIDEIYVVDWLAWIFDLGVYASLVHLAMMVFSFFAGGLIAKVRDFREGHKDR